MSTRRALAFSFLDRYAGLVVSIVASMVVSRLLSPAEIGVFSATMVMLSFASSLRDMGAGQYLLQERELTIDRIRATWTVQLGLGVFFAVLLLAVAHPVAAFYQEPRMVRLMQVLALNFAVSPFGSLTYAWLTREMRFDALALMRFSSNLTGACVSVVMAWRDFGPISLAVGSVAATLLNAALATFFRPASFPWLPGRRELGRVLKVGGKVSLTTVLNTAAHSVPELTLGKLYGMADVGLYSRANGLSSMFQRLVLDATHSVATPLFARAARDGHNIGPIFVTATSYVTAIGWSFLGVLAILAGPAVRVLYGDQWDASVSLTRVIALAMAISLPAAFCATSMLASSAMNGLVRITFMTGVQYAVILGVGAFYGLPGLRWAVPIEALAATLVWLAMSPVMSDVRKSEFARALGGSLAVALPTCACASLAYLYPATAAHAPLVRLLLGSAAACTAFFLALFFFRHTLWLEVRKALSAVQDRFGRHGSAARRFLLGKTL
jgi:O-antigen/teichoic acid export membrane protein